VRFLVILPVNSFDYCVDTRLENISQMNCRRTEMAIQDWSENILLVDLPEEPDMGEELQGALDAAREKGNCDMVIDFSSVDIIASSSISKLLRLRKLLSDCGRQLVFCNVAAATKGIFTVTGLDEVFEFASDKFTALTGLQMASK